MAKRWAVYAAGMLLLALGLSLNTKVGLGVSPIISVPFGISGIWNLNLGNMAFLFYSLFAIIEMLIHFCMWRRIPDESRLIPMRLILIKDILQIPMSLVFTRFLNVFSALIPDLATLDGTIAATIGVRILVLVVAIIITGVGAAMSLDMRLIPNSGDGIVQAISDITGKSMGFTKNCFDAANICISLTIGFVFAGQLVGVGIGTALAVVGVGRSIALFHHFFHDSLAKFTSTGNTSASVTA